LSTLQLPIFFALAKDISTYFLHMPEAKLSGMLVTCVGGGYTEQVCSAGKSLSKHANSFECGGLYALFAPNL
jgi:hypothetical protein